MRAVVLLLDLIDAYILVLSFQYVLRRRVSMFGGFIKISLFVSKQSLRVFRNMSAESSPP